MSGLKMALNVYIRVSVTPKCFSLLRSREDPSQCIFLHRFPEGFVSLNIGKLTYSLFMCGTPGNI